MDYMQFKQNDEGLLPTCLDDPNSTSVPPGNTEPPISFTDIDMDDSPNGNLTLTLQVSSFCHLSTSFCLCPHTLCLFPHAQRLLAMQ